MRFYYIYLFGVFDLKKLIFALCALASLNDGIGQKRSVCKIIYGGAEGARRIPVRLKICGGGRNT